MPTLDHVLRNVYVGPSMEYLRRNVDFGWYIFGQVKVTDLEIKTASNEGAFIALLSARLQGTLEDMARHASEAPFIDAILRWRLEDA